MYRHVLLSTAVAVSWLSFPAVMAAETVTVVPEESHEILANPGMGWQTFHHTAKQDKHLPDWIPSTVHYARWGWGTLEPKPGQIDVDFLEQVLRETRDAGQKLALRVMCCSTTPREPYHPTWLTEVGGRELVCRYEGGTELRVPDLDDPVVLGKHLDFLQRLGRLLDGRNDVDHVDLGTVGWWGEWHMSGSDGKMPRPETQRKIVDGYLASFRRTPLLMLVGGGEMLQYATDHGAGWRADCLGDLGGFSKNWCHMRKGYPVMLSGSLATAVWPRAPVAWETCWDMRKWVDEGWSLRYIFNYALALHGSHINNKSAPLPVRDDVQPELERFLRRLGYRLVLRELTHPQTAQAGQPLELAMQWQNVGSAPCYRPYRLAYRLDSAATSQVLVGQVTVDKWLPGSVDVFTAEFLKSPPDLPPGPLVSVTDKPIIPATVPAGEYILSIGVVDDSGVPPVVRLAIQGRGDDGWYKLSRLRVVP